MQQLSGTNRNTYGVTGISIGAIEGNLPAMQIIGVLCKGSSNKTGVDRNQLGLLRVNSRWILIMESGPEVKV